MLNRVEFPTLSLLLECNMKSFLQLVVGLVMLLLAAKIIWELAGIIFTLIFMVLAMLFKAVLTVAVAFVAVVTVIALIGAIFRS